MNGGCGELHRRSVTPYVDSGPATPSDQNESAPDSLDGWTSAIAENVRRRSDPRQPLFRGGDVLLTPAPGLVVEVLGASGCLQDRLDRRFQFDAHLVFEPATGGVQSVDEIGASRACMLAELCTQPPLSVRNGAPTGNVRRHEPDQGSPHRCLHVIEVLETEEESLRRRRHGRHDHVRERHVEQ